MCKQKLRRLNIKKSTTNFHKQTKHLQGNQIYKIDLSNTSGLQSQTKLPYIYNFKKPTKHKPLQLNYEKSVDHVDKMEAKM